MKERSENKEAAVTNDAEAEEDKNDEALLRKKRRRTEEQGKTGKSCVICDKMKIKGDTKKHRICESKRAKQLLSAMKFFKDDTYRRCIVLETPGDVFAADILYHSNCLSNYLLKFKREVELIIDGKDDLDIDEKTDAVFKEVLQVFDLQHQANHLSSVRDLLNGKLQLENLGK